MVEPNVRAKSRRPARRRGVLVLGLLLALPELASAQSVTIPDEVVRSTTPLASNQGDNIRAYVAEHAPGLSSDDPAQIAQSRTRLLAPLELDGIGVPFRLAYGNEVCAAVEANLGSDDELIVVNTLRLLGEVATDRSVAAVEGVLGGGPGSTPGGVSGDTLPLGVRYTAVYAFARTFEAVAGESPAVAPERVRAVMGQIAELIGAEEDPLVLDVGVRALMSAGTIDKPNFGGIRADAYARLAESVSERLSTMDASVDEGPDRLYFVLRAVVATRDALTDRRSLPATAAQPCAALGGDVLAFARARIDAGVEWPSEERRLLGQAVTVSQATMYFAGTAMSPGTTLATPDDLGRLINPVNPSEEPKDAEFLRRVGPEIARLTAAPYNFPASRFDR